MKQQPVLQLVPVAAIHPSPYQYRARFDDENQRQLVESLRSEGLSTPILVRPHGDGFELVSGERRWRAAKELGWESIRALCEEMTDAEAAARVVTENELRADTNVMEKAAAYRRLTQPPCSLTLQEIAKRYGLTAPSSVKRIVDLLDQPKTIQDFLSQDKIGEAHVRFLSRIKDLDARAKLAKRAADEGWSSRMTEQRVAKLLAKAHGPSSKSAPKNGASYEQIYNGFHCAVFGTEVEVTGRRFKSEEEMLDQFVADYRTALQCVVRDLKEDAGVRPATPSSGELASSTDPSLAAIASAPADPPPDTLPKTSTEITAELLKDAAEVEKAKQTLRDLFSGMAKNTDTTDGGKASDEPIPKPVQENS